jgi:hypothetical protein
MGIIELDHQTKQLHLHAWIITYGNAANETLTRQITEEIETMWNEPKAIVTLNNQDFLLRFFMKGWHRPDLQPDDVQYNANPKNNYFRIEKYAHGNISFVDGLGSNTGYFLLENLFNGSTTAAHEFGHTIGLEHPSDMDYRGKGAPGIMYPRGTLVDPQYQYDPKMPAGEKGGTIYPVHRRVLQEDVTNLNITRLRFENNMAIIGTFSSVWHDAQEH